MIFIKSRREHTQLESTQEINYIIRQKLAYEIFLFAWGYLKG